jgi:translation initiation factor IF-2
MSESVKLFGAFVVKIKLVLILFSCYYIRAMASKTQEKSIQNAQAAAARVQRPPIVVVMGHVDHGKTTLLDSIRKAAHSAHASVSGASEPRSVAEREAGGITQAVGAYEILHDGRRMTFIDTPGHEAFSAMRSRGAQAADLAILVVAADEGLKPQTKEAIQILEESKTPFVIAINKIDRTNGSLDKARNDLLAAGVLLEGFGGQISYHGISAKTGEGVNDLLDLVLLAADLENLEYDPAAPASGFVLEVRREPKRGVEASVIVKNGTLKRGDAIKTHTAGGKVKILEDFMGEIVQSLAPSAPALIIGFESLPAIGEEFFVGELVTAPRAAVAVPAVSGKPNKTALTLLLKASDAGSLEALAVVLENLPRSKEKGLRIVEASVGDVTDGDVKHALATGATIIGFKNKIEKGALMLADAQSVLIITSKIVYDLSKAVEEFLDEETSGIAGELEVLAIFNQVKLDKQLIGGRITEGSFKPKLSFEIMRSLNGETPKSPLGSGRIVTLREQKSEIFIAEKGKEIGLVVGSAHAIQVGDKLVIKK